MEFRNEQDVGYAIRVLNNIRLYGKPIRVSRSAGGARAGTIDVGANLALVVTPASTRMKTLLCQSPVRPAERVILPLTTASDVPPAPLGGSKSSLRQMTGKID